MLIIVMGKENICYPGFKSICAIFILLTMITLVKIHFGAPKCVTAFGCFDITASENEIAFSEFALVVYIVNVFV